MAPATLSPASSPSPGSDCPDPKACRAYRYTAGASFKGWRPSADGLVRIRFWINPTPPVQTSFSSDLIESMILTATKTWAAASPRLCFLYQGRTTREPFTGDGYTDFSLGTTVQEKDDGEAYRVEADIQRDAFRSGWSWDPCEQRDGSCIATGKSTLDMQNILTHEIGHVLGLGDLYDEQVEEDARRLTMNPGSAVDGSTAVAKGERNKVTLGLGDILGIRALHPCDCSLPPIYDP